MTPERLAEIQIEAVAAKDTFDEGMDLVDVSYLFECLDEIERLRDWLYIVSEGSVDLTEDASVRCSMIREVAERALAGKAVPDA